MTRHHHADLAPPIARPATPPKTLASDSPPTILPHSTTPTSRRLSRSHRTPPRHDTDLHRGMRDGPCLHVGDTVVAGRGEPGC